MEFKQRMASLLKAYPPASEPPPASTASTPEIDLIALNLTCPYCLMEYKQTGRLGSHIVKKHMVDPDNIVLKCKYVKKSISSTNLETTADITADSEIVPVRS